MAKRTTTPRVAIIGAGFAGVAAAVKLRRAGIDTFTVFERGDSYGGVWRDNTYPGAEVDTPSHWYSFSFKQWDWTRTHGQQAHLYEYINATAAEYNLPAQTRFGTAVTKVIWDESRHQYAVSTDAGDTEYFDVVISALGLFNQPKYPDWPGLDTFTGPVFHTAQWQHQHDLSDKHVAIVGTGSTGVQLAVALAPKVKHLTIFQRDPGWITPKGERDLSEEERAVLRDPKTYKKARRKSFWMEQQRFWGGKQFQAGTKINKQGSDVGQAYIDAVLKDHAELKESVTPNHPFMGKRPVRASGFYETLLRDNVTFVPKAVQSVTPTSIVDADGVDHPVDVIVLATGFKAAEYLGLIDLVGSNGVSIHDHWNGVPDAFLGLTVPGYPNFYMLYGPNTNMGTIVFPLEVQSNYAVRDIKRMHRTDVTAIEVKPGAHRRYNRWLKKKLAKTVWVDTPSYYKLPSGEIPVPYPTAMVVYWAHTRLFRVTSSKTRRLHTAR